MRFSRQLGAKEQSSQEVSKMDFITKMFVKAHHWQNGQTLAEYALILSAVAVIVYAGYLTMGTTITSLVTTVDGGL